MSSLPSIVTDTDRDERLARLLDELSEQVRQGQPANVEALASANPDLARSCANCGPPLNSLRSSSARRSKTRGPGDRETRRGAFRPVCLLVCRSP